MHDIQLILSIFLANYPYIIAFLMVVAGIFLMIIEKNLIKKIIGLNVMQGGMILFFILISKIYGGLPPIYNNKYEILSNPLPHVLMLTAIVVGIATLAVAFSLIYRIYITYNTIDEHKIMKKLNQQDNNG